MITMTQQEKQKTLKEKLIILRDQIKKPILMLLTLLPILGLLMYALPFPMMDLWSLFVENLFGNFWIAVFFIAMIFFLILILGGISYYTVIIFMMYYFLAMSIGYGNVLFTVPITIFALLYFSFQAFKFLNNQ